MAKTEIAAPHYMYAGTQATFFVEATHFPGRGGHYGNSREDDYNGQLAGDSAACKPDPPPVFLDGSNMYTELLQSSDAHLQPQIPSSRTLNQSAAYQTTVLSADARCPYPYPDIYCGKSVTTLVPAMKDLPTTTNSGQDLQIATPTRTRVTATQTLVLVMVSDIVLQSLVHSTTTCTV
ncbi:hypothetical protein IQ07DRAFT_645133 [Pyrenochaeta sp. DS3sAY3a]|nr:hypothetical protein IQ07DRAFT_645133 [Pyrenochaeta sp. DS3sAY3a]